MVVLTVCRLKKRQTAEYSLQIRLTARSSYKNNTKRIAMIGNGAIKRKEKPLAELLLYQSAFNGFFVFLKGEFHLKRWLSANKRRCKVDAGDSLLARARCCQT